MRARVRRSRRSWASLHAATPRRLFARHRERETFAGTGSVVSARTVA